MSFRQSRAYRIIVALLLTVGCAWVGYEMYKDMTAYENGETGLVLNNVIMIAYDVLGKWGALTVWAVISGFVVWLFCLQPKPK